MNGSLQSVIELVEAIKAGDVNNAQLAVCRPAIYRMKVGVMLEGSRIAVGAQNVCGQQYGDVTGAIAAW